MAIKTTNKTESYGYQSLLFNINVIFDYYNTTDCIVTGGEASIIDVCPQVSMRFSY